METTGRKRKRKRMNGIEGETEGTRAKERKEDRRKGSKRVETKTTKSPIVLALGQTKTAGEARRVRAVYVCVCVCKGVYTEMSFSYGSLSVCYYSVHEFIFDIFIAISIS